MAQKSITVKLHSRYVNETIPYTVWLPANWVPDEKYTTIYTFSYGASDAAFTVQQIQYLNKLHITPLPPVIVVNVWADMDRMGYNYESGLLTVNGTRMLECLKNEIIPQVEQKYKASKFRTYMGQSYGASYGNYLFMHQPELFSGYILMSPEKLSAAHPPFDITPGLAAFYSTRPTFYFLASGALDLQRRQDYTKEIAGKIKQLDSSTFHYQYYNLAEAGHNNSTAMGLPLALDFIYQQYTPDPELNGESDMLTSINKYATSLTNLYGTLPEKNVATVYLPFLTYTWQHKDSSAMKAVISYFLTEKSGGRQLRDFAYSCVVVGLKEKAKELYQRAIDKISASEMSQNMGPSSLITCYRELAFNVLNNDPRAGWALLQKALATCLLHKDNIYIGYYPDIYYYLGQFAVNNNFNLKKGLDYLLVYQAKRPGLVDIIHDNIDGVYYYTGKCYFMLHDFTNARLYLKKATDYNPANKAAKELLLKAEHQ
ncbi:hypothetical protein GCM10027043_08240 [Ferruginibacter profundus]